jgi:hypothetical protein
VTNQMDVDLGQLLGRQDHIHAGVSDDLHVEPPLVKASRWSPQIAGRKSQPRSSGIANRGWLIHA